MSALDTRELMARVKEEMRETIRLGRIFEQLWLHAEEEIEALELKIAGLDKDLDGALNAPCPRCGKVR